MKRFVLIGACVAWAFGCPSSDGDDDQDKSPDGGKTPEAGGGGAGTSGSGGKDDGKGGAPAPSSDEIVGHFSIELTAPAAATALSAAKVGSTSVSGKVYDAPVPSGTVWDTAAEAGDCKLLTPRAPFCDPACVGGVCVEDDQCQPNPKAHSVGTLHVKGVMTTTGATEFDVTAVNNSYMNDADASLPYPAFDAGDKLTFSTSGGDYAPISVTLEGIAPLQLIENDVPELSADKALKLAWMKPQDGAKSRIFVKLDISHHGGSKGKIECDTDDSGSLEIAASLVSKLIDLGVAGFPTVIITRSTVASAAIEPGLVEFEASMDQERAVKVPGLMSCTVDVDCESGQTCQTDLTCQ